jgi:plasmid stabilization system protein ParE
MSFRKPVKLSPKAGQDFVDILRYTGENWGQNQLLNYRDKIDQALQAIGTNPSIGHRRDDLPEHIGPIWWGLTSSSIEPTRQVLASSGYCISACA